MQFSRDFISQAGFFFLLDALSRWRNAINNYCPCVLWTSRAGGRLVSRLRNGDSGAGGGLLWKNAESLRKRRKTERSIVIKLVFAEYFRGARVFICMKKIFFIQYPKKFINFVDRYPLTWQSNSSRLSIQTLDKPRICQIQSYAHRCEISRLFVTLFCDHDVWSVHSRCLVKWKIYCLSQTL